nr:biliverdin-producing heme oxygenase [uncultured Cohaesibacter sp.]
MQALEQLKIHTRHLHETLDANVSKNDVTSEFGYKRFLKMHASILPTLEPWLMEQPAFHTLPEAASRLRASCVQADLALMEPSGSNDSFVDLGSGDFFFLKNNASVVGVSYVLEGSRLGGVYLSKKIKKLRPDLPTSFLEHGQGKTYWKTFKSWVEALDMTAHDIREAIISAQDVFLVYLSAIEQDRSRHVQ